MGEEPPGVTMDPDAGGFRAVGLRQTRPMWGVRPTVPEKGRYQLMVRARGSLAGSAFPTLGLVAGERLADAGASRLVHSAWHWLPVGGPQPLEAREQWLGVNLANPLNYRNQVVRAAEIDCYELRRVEDAVGETDAGGGGRKAPVARGLGCAFTSIFDGLAVNGSVRVAALLASPALRNDNDYRLIRSELWVNGRRTASSAGRQPAFTLFPHDLRPGRNEVQVRAFSPCGNHAASVVQTLLATAQGLPAEPLATTWQTERQELANGKWTDAKPVAIGADSALAGEDAPASAHGVDAKPVTLALPPEIAGPRRVSVLLRAPEDGAARDVAVILRQPGAAEQRLRLGRVRAGDGWAWHELGEVELQPGPKSIVVRAANDRPGTAAMLGGLSVDSPRFVDAAPPELRILYPRPDSVLDAAGDVLVLEVFDDLRISSFDVHVDGKKTPLAQPLPREAGPVVLYLSGSSLPPGPHRISVTARDASGKTTRSEEIQVTAEAGDSPVLTHAYPRAVRLARRLGYGADPDVIAGLLTNGEEAWLESQLSGPSASAADEAIAALARLRYPNTGAVGQVRGRVAEDLLRARDVLRARFTMFAMNHFSTWITKTGAPAQWDAYRAFRTAGVARFADLLLISATSPAMMVYLDQQNSIGRNLNENYAREIMELHTVGVDAGYRQQDVTELAQLLTGWGAQREALPDGSATGYAYRFAPYLNLNAPVTVFGLRVPPAESPDQADDRVAQVVEMLSARPETARFLSAKLVAHILGHPAPEDVSGRLEKVFLASGGDFRALLRALVAEPAFMLRQPPPKLLLPLEFALATQRTAGSANPGWAVTLTDRSGRGIFDRVSPDGYPEACEEYADSNYQLQKWNHCRDAEAALAAPLAYGWFDAKALESAEHRDAVIDLAMQARFGEPPAPATREALHGILLEPLSDPNQRRRLFASFLHMVPEAQYR